jgi:hypothetical protein
MSIHGLEEMKVVSFKGGKAMSDLLYHNAPSHAEGYWLMMTRKTPTKSIIVMDMSSVHHFDICNTVKRVGSTVLFVVTRITYNDDPETCWRIEWEAYGLKWRVQFFWDTFIDMDMEERMFV